MKYKIGIQLFGKLRLNKFCLDYFVSLKNYLYTKGYDIHYHGCFWNEPNVQELLNNHPIIFNTLRLEQYPKSGYHTQKFIEDFSKVITLLSDVNKKSSCLFLSHYLLYKSYSQRKKYEYENNLKYDFIICQRPDYLMNIRSIEHELDSLFKKRILVSYKIYSGSQNPHYTKYGFPTCNGTDFLFGGDSRTMDLFCSSYNYFYNDDKKHYYKTHHLNFTQVIKTFNLWLNDSWTGTLIRTETPHEENDGTSLLGIDEYKKIQSWKDDSTPSKND